MPSIDTAPLTRSAFARRLAAAAALAALPARAAAATTPSARATAPPPPKHVHDMDEVMRVPGATGAEKIALALYPGFTFLDLVGPHHFFTAMMGAEVALVAATLDPVRTDTGVAILPQATFSDPRAPVDVLFVPGGGEGTLAAMRDPALLAFLRAHAREKTVIASVCTGSLVLGAAGLLAGYRANSHWTVRDRLADFGAVPTDERVVIDRNRMTAAGVSAGLDLGLAILQRLRGTRYAQLAQEFSEYAPAPPLHAGDPKTAPPENTAMLRRMMRGYDDDVRAIARARVKSA